MPLYVFAGDGIAGVGAKLVDVCVCDCFEGVGAKLSYVSAADGVEG